MKETTAYAIVKELKAAGYPVCLKDAPPRRPPRWPPPEGPPQPGFVPGPGLLPRGGGGVPGPGLPPRPAPPMTKASRWPSALPTQMRTMRLACNSTAGTQNSERYGSEMWSTAGRIVVACAMIIDITKPRRTAWVTVS